jgi:hypothetical protein
LNRAASLFHDSAAELSKVSGKQERPHQSSFTVLDLLLLDKSPNPFHLPDLGTQFMSVVYGIALEGVGALVGVSWSTVIIVRITLMR